MRRIVIFPGKLNGVFFLNEIEYLKKYFDEIVILTYPCMKNDIRNISTTYNLKTYVIKSSFFSIFSFSFIKWLFYKETKNEIIKNCRFTKQGIMKFLYILNYGLFFIKSKKILDKIIFSDMNTIFYSYWLTRGAYTITFYNLIRNLNIKTISRAHGYDLYEYRNKANFLPFRNCIYNNISKLYFISNNGIKYFIDKYHDTHNLTEFKLSRLGTFNKQGIYKQIENKRDICIASCSNINYNKRLDLIIDILSIMNIPVKWIHIGAGPLELKIKKYAKDKLNKNSYMFLGELQNNSILETYLKFDVDFFINMSDSEGVPVSIMEAISIGIPVIARDVGGIKDILNENNGLLLSSDENLISYANSIKTFLMNRIKNTEMYIKYSKSSIKEWDNKYNADKNYTYFFNDLIEISN